MKKYQWVSLFLVLAISIGVNTQGQFIGPVPMSRKAQIDSLAAKPDTSNLRAAKDTTDTRLDTLEYIWQSHSGATGGGETTTPVPIVFEIYRPKVDDSLGVAQTNYQLTAKFYVDSMDSWIALNHDSLATNKIKAKSGGKITATDTLVGPVKIKGNLTASGAVDFPDSMWTGSWAAVSGVTGSAYPIRILKNQNSQTGLFLYNNTAGTAANVNIRLQSNSSSGYLFLYDDGFTTTNMADRLILWGGTDATAVTIVASATTAPIEFYSGGYAAANLEAIITPDSSRFLDDVKIDSSLTVKQIYYLNTYPAADSTWGGGAAYPDTAGETLTMGTPVRKLSNNRWYKADANVDSLMPAEAVWLSKSTTAGAAGRWSDDCILRIDAWTLVLGSGASKGEIMVSTTSTLTTTAPSTTGDLKQIVGFAINPHIARIKVSSTTVEIK